MARDSKVRRPRTVGEVRSKEKSERSCEAWGKGRRGKNLEASTLAAKFFDFPRRFGSGETISVRGEGGCVGGVRTACSNWSPSIRCIQLSVASSAAFSTVATRPSARQPLRQIASCLVSFIDIRYEIQLSGTKHRTCTSISSWTPSNDTMSTNGVAVGSRKSETKRPAEVFETEVPLPSGEFPIPVIVAETLLSHCNRNSRRSLFHAAGETRATDERVCFT